MMEQIIAVLIFLVMFGMIITEKMERQWVSLGASANVVGVSIAAQNGHVIGWGKYCKVMAPVTVISVLVSMLCIYVRYL